MIGDRYRIIEQLGRGGFGKTYLVEDSNRFNECCVLKVFAPEVNSPKALKKAKELFNREAEVLYRLEHPQIPKFREWFMDAPTLYLVQDYVEGPTYQAILRQRKQQRQPFFSESEVTSFLKQALPVLDYIHSKGMIHRDISPDNLIQRVCDRKPILIDFGGVKEITASFGRFEGDNFPNAALTLIGKPGYAPEEQIRLGRVSPASDIYALGVTALVLLVGQEPQNFFDPNSCTFKWQQFVTLSPEFAAVLDKMVASHAVKRYRSSAQVLQDLNHLEIATIVGQSAQHGAVFDQQVSETSTRTTATAVATPPSTQQSTQQTLVAPIHSLGPVAKVGNRLRNGLMKLLQAVAIFSVMLIAGALGFGAIYSWLQQSPATSETTERSESTAPETETFSKDEQSRKTALLQRVRSLNVGVTYFNQVTNEAFYLKYPSYSRRPLTKSAADAKLRAQWDQVGSQVVESLETISATSRRRIGRYGMSTRQAWDQQLREARINSNQFYRDVDRQFRRQLPMYQSDTLANKRGQQIWYALAADRLQQELRS